MEQEKDRQKVDEVPRRFSQLISAFGLSICVGFFIAYAILALGLWKAGFGMAAGVMYLLPTIFFKTRFSALFYLIWGVASCWLFFGSLRKPRTDSSTEDRK